jgi:hypothetical protein
MESHNPNYQMLSQVTSEDADRQAALSVACQWWHEDASGLSGH